LFTTSLAALAMAAPHVAREARAYDRDVELRFLPAGSVIVDGYRVYIVDETTEVEHLIDLGYVAPDPDGIARSAVVLDSATSYFVGMTSYKDSAESDLSNQIPIPALNCNASACDDGNPCTIDGCDESGCLNPPVADGSACDDVQVDTVEGDCLSGVCRGSADDSAPADVLAVTGIAPDVSAPGNVDVEIYGEGFAVGASLRFENGVGPAPRVRSLLLLDTRTLLARVEVRRQGPKRSRFWDAVVALPDGNEARLLGALRVDP
jgi:hypothetical protein